MTFRPKRGDIVAYGEYLYFFQPNGSVCRLYSRSEDIGVKGRIVLSPRRSAIREPDELRRDAFRAADVARRQWIQANTVPASPPILPEIIIDD